MINQYICQQQGSKQNKGIQANSNQLNKKAELYSAGKFDGVIGNEADPDLASNLSYRQGYQIGFWQFFDEKYGIKKVTGF